MKTKQAMLNLFEGTLLVSAIVLAFIVQGIAHEGFACVLASGVFVGLNFRLWRLIASAAQRSPSILPVAIMLKLPLLAVGVYALLLLGKPWMVAVGISNFFISAVVTALYVLANKLRE